MKARVAMLTIFLAAQITAGFAALGPSLSAFAATPATPPNFQITANPDSLTISASNSATSTITLTSLNGLAGTISLSATISPLVPAGPQIALSPRSVTLTSGGTGTSVLTVSTTTTTANGGFTITVTGTKNSVTNSALVQVTIVGGTVGAESVPLDTFSLVLPYAAVVVAALAGTAAYIFAVRRRL